ncbi:MAG: elongation factor G [Bacilli bacterium]
MDFHTSNIRNIAVLGHQGSGKTSLVEALSSITDNVEAGTIERRNTISDFLIEEKNRNSSCSLSVVPVFYSDYKINLIDIPGNDDFIYEALGVTRLIKGAILLIDASKGIEVETIKHFNLLKKRGIPTIIFLNKMDKDNVNFDSLLTDIQDKFGKQCIPFAYPIGKNANLDGFVNVVTLKARKYNGKECVDDVIYDDKKQIVLELHSKIAEQVAMSDDKLLEKFFAGETLTMDEIHNGLRAGVLDGNLTPIMVGSATKKIGMHTLLDMFIKYMPNPEHLKPYKGIDETGKEIERLTKDSEPFSAYVFKTQINTYTGLYSIVKINSGVLSLGDEIYCPNSKFAQKVTSMFFLKGDTKLQTSVAYAGDIVAIAKLENVKTGDTICSSTNSIMYKPVIYPTAVYFIAIEVADKKYEDKLNGVLNKIKAEDPCIEVRRNVETKQTLIGGTSETHLNYVFEKIRNNYDIELLKAAPKISYRETIKKKATAEGRYIKQSGGSGFYAVVNMAFEPSGSYENIFTEEVFGGAVPKNYFPAVEKGFFEATKEGMYLGYPIIGVKSTLLDGKYHDVDSNELAFKMASIIAFKEAYNAAIPALLEPYIKVVISCQQENIGNVMSDLNQRRARISSMDEDPSTGYQEIIAIVPEAEMLDYVSKLRVLTQGGGYFNREFDSYQEVPALILEKIMPLIKNN